MSIDVLMGEIELSGAISRHSSDVILVGNETIRLTIAGTTDVAIITGPAVIVADFHHSANFPDSMIPTYRVGKIRQIIYGHVTREVRTPINEGIRKVFRDLAVEGVSNWGGVKLTCPEFPGLIDVPHWTGLYRIKTEGGFIPYVPLGWAAVAVNSPLWPNPKTSWIIARDDDPRIE